MSRENASSCWGFEDFTTETSRSKVMAAILVVLNGEYWTLLYES